jgi:N-ethylmaleimide reductase
MTLKTTLTSHTLGSHSLKNRIAMSPMTRSRAINNIPNQLMAKYYAQRASAGLIITEGVSPSPNGLGYSRMPGIFSEEQIAGWKLVTAAVHAKGGKIVMQMMHSGRIGHGNNLPAGARIVAPSAIAAAGEMWTDKEGKKPHPIPQELDAEELELTKLEFVQGARNAMAAGFDGIELHGANGYLLEQFLSPHTNRRTDNYGGSIENRARFVLEVAQEIADAIGKDKVGIRLSPHGAAGDMPAYDEVKATYSYLAEELSQIGIAYVHVVDHSSLGAPEVPLQLKQLLRNKFKGTFILAGGYDGQKAEDHLNAGLADLIGFGRPFINNPDFVERIINNLPLNPILDASTFYTATEKGYTDYPVYAEEAIVV